MFNMSKIYKGYSINITCFKIGNDFNITIYGGDTPHIGAIAVSYPNKIINYSDISPTISLITLPGHKEDSLALESAKILCKTLNSTVVVSCGIHYDDFEFSDIENINKIVKLLIEKTIKNYTNN